VSSFFASFLAIDAKLKVEMDALEAEVDSEENHPILIFLAKYKPGFLQQLHGEFFTYTK